MRIRGELYLIVLLALYNVSTASDGAAPSERDSRDTNHCHWTSASRGRVHYGFLREPSRPGTRANARRLYFSTWTENRRLVDCEIVEEPAVADRYLSLCLEKKRAWNFLASPDERFNISLLLATANPCVVRSVTGSEPFAGRAKRNLLQPVDPGRSLLSRPTVSSAPRVRRRKRSWILFPGTLWCGTGTNANGYEDIGVFGKTDRCCREHDHCQRTIPSFRVNYGAFNPNLYTVSHCSCDSRFRQCLQEVNDTVAHMVGYSFFNMLKVPCFDLTQTKHCTQYSWWGLCKSVQVAPYAVFRNQSPYNSSQPARVDKVSKVMAVPASPAVTPSPASRPAAGRVRNDSEPMREGANLCQARGSGRGTSEGRGRCGPRGPTRGDTFPPNRKPGPGGKGRKGAKPPTANRKTTTSTRSSTTSTRISSTRPRTTNTSSTRPTTTTSTTHLTSTSTRPSTTSTRPTSTTSTTHPSTTSTRPSTTNTSITRPTTKTSTTHPTSTSTRPSTTSTRPTSTTSTTHPSTTSTRPSTTNTSITRPTTKTSTTHPTSTTTPSSISTTTSGRNSEKTLGSKRQLGGSKNALPAHLPWAPPKQANSNLPAPVENSRHKDRLQLCDCYRELDECKYKILPYEEKFGLRNMEPKTLYHCACARGLSRHLRQQSESRALQSLITGFVSLFCFKGLQLEQCLHRTRCQAVLSESKHLKQTLRRLGVTEVTGSPLGSAPKVKRQNARKGSGKGGRGGLYQRCLRMTGETAT